MNPTNWTPGIVVLITSVVAGILFVLLSRRGAASGAVPAPAVKREEELEDLDQRYRMLVAQLKELETDRHLVGEARYAAEKNRLEREAVDVLRARDGQAAATAKASAKAPQTPVAARRKGPLANYPQLKGALWGGGVVGFFVLLGWLLSQEQKDKPEQQNPTQQAQQPAEQEDPRFLAAIERMRKNSEDVEAAAEVAHELIRRQDFQEAGRITDQAIGVDPFHLETRIHRAVIQAVGGDGAGALAALEHLGQMYPGAHEAFLYAGALAMEAGNRPKALEHFDRFLADAPLSEHPPMLQMAVRQMRAELGAESADGGVSAMP